MVNVTPIKIHPLSDDESGFTFKVARSDSTFMCIQLKPNHTVDWVNTVLIRRGPFQTDNHMIELVNTVLISCGPLVTDSRFDECVIRWSRIISDYKCLRKHCLNMRLPNSKYCDYCDFYDWIE